MKMGMFDTIICKYPLPGNPPEFAAEDGHSFQTKDLECDMTEYTIDAEGVFYPWPDPDGFTGTIDFYTSNITGGGPGVYTLDGSDAVSVQYRATIVDGRLKSLVETARDIGPAWPSTKHRATIIWTPPTPEEKADRKARENECLTGKCVYLLWGGQDDGQYVTVVAEGKRTLIVQLPENDKYREEFSTLHRSDRDRLFFDTEEEAKADRKVSTDAWDAGRAEWKAFETEWNERNGLKAVPQ